MGEPTVSVAQIRDAAQQRRELVVQLQRELHRIPELSFAERETTHVIEEFLAGRGVVFDRFGADTGGVAVVGEGERCVILRADIDALPVTEADEMLHRSVHRGCMHACGHDAHTAMLLAVADVFASGEVSCPGRVVCLFQPAEERGGGCARFIEQGLLQRYPARGAAALHVWPQLATGTVALTAGPVMASMDTFRLQFQGRGGHGAYPHGCIDPVVMAAEAVMALQTLVSRRVDPQRPALVTVGRMCGGTAPNIIPDVVDVEGTVRTFDPEVRHILLEGIRGVSEGVSRAHGGSCRYELIPGYPVTRNHPAATALVRGKLEAVFGAGQVVNSEPTMGSEDMSFLLERVPGCYIRLGAAADPEHAAPLHSPRFHIDEDCLPLGVAALLAAAYALASDHQDVREEDERVPGQGLPGR